ncbi:hypothetical protein CRE_30246 [Caenorhabditis remanei]|uniref:Phlebovirus glycoprotein G2 fusion domain-containing protein n=1 Tax=Caenorhabditis remanei TaxID=31234 RepID=E3NK31_CAERE|nr:hypothetical protein CRE_30246 [Caenorhabditis remanei]
MTELKGYNNIGEFGIFEKFRKSVTRSIFVWSAKRCAPGCLFYRIYGKEKNNGTLEIFQCAEWRERLVIEMSITRLNGDRHQKTETMTLSISFPGSLQDITVTAAWINKPVSPILENWLIKNDKSQVALWQPYRFPSIQCKKKEGDETCQLNERCTCEPAEDSMKRLPVREGHWTLKAENDSVVATINDEVTFGLVLTLEDNVTTSILILSDKCYIKAKQIQGCYNCASGGQAEIKCTSSMKEVIGNIICDKDMFTVPCSPNGKSTNITFFAQYAGFRKVCSINCGGKYTEYFKITGTLKFTGSMWTSIYRIIEGKTTLMNEIAWPDLSHLAPNFGFWLLNQIIPFLLLPHTQSFLSLPMEPVVCCLSAAFSSF